MENTLRIYNVTFALRYYTYDLHSEAKDSEFVMGLKQPVDWDVEHLVEEEIPGTQQVFRNCEKVHFNLSCENDSENESMPADYFNLKITNIVVHNQEEAYSFVKPYLYRVCRTLSFLLSVNNCNKHSYQPRVEADIENAAWDNKEYELFDQVVNQGEENKIETTWIDGKKCQVITIESEPITISSRVYLKIYGRMPVEDFLDYTDCTNTDINYMLDEFYLALGQENKYSKFFHLFSIIEFVEKRYKNLNGANKLVEPDKADEVMKKVLEILNIEDSKKRESVKSSFKQKLCELTDIGRNDKIVNILHEMGIDKISNCGTEFEIDAGLVGGITRLRNKCYHGDYNKHEKSGADIDLAVTRLMYICERIILHNFKNDRLR